MTINTKTTLAILALVAGFGGATQIQAGEGTVMLGSSNFADRCDTIGGALFDVDGGYACDLGTTLVACEFEGAYADCEWDGVANQIKVVRLIGMLHTESLVGNGGGSGVVGGGGGGKGGVQKLDLPIKNNE